MHKKGEVKIIQEKWNLETQPRGNDRIMNVDSDGKLVAWLAIAPEENFPNQINCIMLEGKDDVAEMMNFSLRS